MPIQHDAEGGINVNGCSALGLEPNYELKYSPGERVWVSAKARKGLVESVVIKRYSRNRRRSRISYEGAHWQIAYTDTFNRVWMEYELATEQEAAEMVADYDSRRSARIRDYYDKGGCLPVKPERCA